MSINGKMTELADAVRELTGSSELMTLDTMIQNLRGAGGSYVVVAVSGQSMYLTDSLNKKLYGLSLYGQTLQNGTPVPASPVELVSAGSSGSVKVNVADQVLTVDTPGGLPGLPVSSDGNYTDTSGQQWLCDEINFESGKYIQRVLQYTFDGSTDEGWASTTTNTSGKYRMRTRLMSGLIVGSNSGTIPANCKCSHYKAVVAGTNGTWGANEGISVETTGDVLIRDPNRNTLNEWIAFLSENPITCVFQLTEPVETDLPVELLLAYSRLHTNSPQTVIFNDAGVWMTVKYAADTKSYVDGRFSEIAAAVVNNI